MTDCRFYKVADHVFSVTLDERVTGNMGENGTDGFFARCMDNYEPFAIPEARNLAFALAVQPSAPLDYTEEIRQEDEGQTVICGHTVAGEALASLGPCGWKLRQVQAEAPECFCAVV